MCLKFRQFLVLGGSCFFIFFSNPSYADCIGWFLGTAINPGTKTCTMECEVAKVDMDSFTCPGQCELLCKVVIPQYTLDNFSYTKGLTQAEKYVISQRPLEALGIYQAKLRAESSTERLFGGNYRNDESDAFRHFVWAALSSNLVGIDQARRFLEAHENNVLQSSDEQRMDLKNNEAGFKAASSIKEKGFSIGAIEKRGLELLKNGELDVIAPRNFIPTWSE